jgi:hypothetical protein
MKTLSISEAKRRFGRVADQALRGETVIIVRKSRLLQLQEYKPIEPVPMRPPGYFKKVYSKVEIRKMNRMEAESAQQIAS